MINVSIDPQDMKKAARGLINQLASKIDKDYMQAVLVRKSSLIGLQNLSPPFNQR